MQQIARKVDQLYPQLKDFFIGDDGIPVIKKTPTLKPTKKTEKLVKKIHSRMPERNLLDVLCLTHHLTGWAHEFGHISGAESRIDNPTERYIFNVFCQGTGMGPTQGAKHIKNSNISPHMLSWINRRHVTTKQLDKAKDKLINYSTLFLLTTAWGDGRRLRIIFLPNRIFVTNSKEALPIIISLIPTLLCFQRLFLVGFGKLWKLLKHF